MAGVTQKWNSLWNFLFSSRGPYSTTAKNITREAVQKMQRYLANRERGLQIQKKLYKHCSPMQILKRFLNLYAPLWSMHNTEMDQAWFASFLSCYVHSCLQVCRWGFQICNLWHIFAYTYSSASEDRLPLEWVRVTDSSYTAYKGGGSLISQIVGWMGP